MDRLDSIFRTTFRPEKTDTSMGIKRQEQQDRRPPKDHEKPEEDDPFGDDHTTLSVAALLGFLQSLLQQSGADMPHRASAQGEHDITVLPAPEQAAQDPHRMAANAYQSTAQHASPHTPDPARMANAAPSIDLSPEDQKIIRDLLRDVETLSARGITAINLHPAARFLDSLAAGVREALHPGGHK